MDWIQLAQDRDKRQVVVNTVMYLKAPKIWGFLDQLRNY
jgi:hypothetical protein